MEGPPKSTSQLSRCQSALLTKTRERVRKALAPQTTSRVYLGSTDRSTRITTMTQSESSKIQLVENDLKSKLAQIIPLNRYRLLRSQSNNAMLAKPEKVNRQLGTYSESRDPNKPPSSKSHLEEVELLFSACKIIDNY